jgi:aspartate/methionine/tyrosine aminotransferase
MPKFPELELSESKTLEINTVAVAKRQTGETVYNLSAGEAYIDLDPNIESAIARAVAEGKTKYPPVAGIPELRSAACDWVNKAFRGNYNPGQCLVTPGGKMALFYLFQSFLKPGDEVIIISPYWVSYPVMIKLFGGKPVILERQADEAWHFDPAQLEKLVTPKTRLIVINNGANPSGVLYTQDEIDAVFKIVKKHDLFLISDEVYSGLAYDDDFRSFADFPEVTKNVVIVQSCSKNFAMTGLRVGFAFADKKIIELMAKLQSQSTSGAATIMQYAALAAVLNWEKIIPGINEELKARRDLFFNELKTKLNQEHTPSQAGLYAFLNLDKLTGSKEKDSDRFCLKLINEANVASVPGSAFGKSDFVRFSYGATKQKITGAVAALAKFIS